MFPPHANIRTQQSGCVCVTNAVAIFGGKKKLTAFKVEPGV